MPYIKVDTTEKLTDDLKKQLCAEIAEMITVLPGKKIERTMVQIEDQQFMIFAGSYDKILRVRVDLYKESPLEAKQLFTEKISQLLSEKTVVPAERIYVTYAEFENWGSSGKLR